jgi:hypothetical protein
MNSLPAIPLEGIAATGMIDQDTAHRLGCSLHKPAATAERTLTPQFQVGFMHQSRGIECMVTPFLGQPCRRQATEFLVDLGQEFRWVHFFSIGFGNFSFSACHFFTSSGLLVSL